MYLAVIFGISGRSILIFWHLHWNTQTDRQTYSETHRQTALLLLWSYITNYQMVCWLISNDTFNTYRLYCVYTVSALDQWCLRMMIGIKWYQFVRNDDVRRLTKQPKLTAIIQSHRLTLFRHIMCMDGNADDKRILLASPRSSPHHMAQHRPTGSETTPPYAPRSRIFGSEPPSAEDDVDVWRYAILELHARNDDTDNDTVTTNVQ